PPPPPNTTPPHEKTPPPPAPTPPGGATTTAPAVTANQVNCTPVSAGLCQPMSITYSTLSAQVGYAYQSSSSNVSQCLIGNTGGQQVFMLESVNDSGLLQNGAPD